MAVSFRTGVSWEVNRHTLQQSGPMSIVLQLRGTERRPGSQMAEKDSWAKLHGAFKIRFVKC